MGSLISNGRNVETGSVADVHNIPRPLDSIVTLRHRNFPSVLRVFVLRLGKINSIAPPHRTDGREVRDTQGIGFSPNGRILPSSGQIPRPPRSRKEKTYILRVLVPTEKCPGRESDNRQKGPEIPRQQPSVYGSSMYQLGGRRLGGKSWCGRKDYPDLNGNRFVLTDLTFELKD